jgi:hypothetical protein
MGSGGKRKTTMAKLNRERRLRERRDEKAAKKVRRRAEAERAAAGAPFAEEEPAGDEL